MTNQLPDASFDYNLLNSLFDILGLTLEDKKELAQEIIQAVLQKAISASNLDVDTINKLGNESNYNQLATYLASQVQDKKEFITIFESATISLVSVLIDEFYQIASLEQQEKMNKYLDEYNLRTQFVA